ncbi:histone-lysine N-methyltransferase, H3 lysine-79 specific-like [Temnothorax curvispinosus]|uniref:Histone-lysine N-methyltransferase, H3 lysine-79 specific-like n=1 Tax=Temnothorax curvispinosus TaxID=300111 RepID=A0A6J1REZ5_9HYME|nr:histone-lysine N-methyltransferase, H3 lysine-79 specific-like [Temnothorax curvispinosus]
MECKGKKIIEAVEEIVEEKVKKMLRKVKEDGLKVKVEIREVRVIGQRGVWLTILVNLGDEEKKWRVLEAKRRAGNSIGVKMDEDKMVERRDRERKEKKRRLERRREDFRSAGRSEEDEIARGMEEKLLMSSDEEKEDKRKREWAK